MKTHSPPDSRRKRTRPRPSNRFSLNVSGEIELLRMRVVAAESLLKEAREQARRAKRRRKLAKLLAKRTRKDAKQAKLNLADAKASLARAEAALRTDRRRTVKRKIRRPKAAARTVGGPVTKRSATARASGSRDSLPSRGPLSAGLKKIPVKYNLRTVRPEPNGPTALSRPEAALKTTSKPDL